MSSFGRVRRPNRVKLLEGKQQQQRQQKIQAIRVYLDIYCQPQHDTIYSVWLSWQARPSPPFRNRCSVVAAAIFKRWVGTRANAITGGHCLISDTMVHVSGVRTLSWNAYLTSGLEKMMGNIMDYKDYQEFYILCNSLPAISCIFFIFFINYILLSHLFFISLYYNKRLRIIFINIYLFYLFIFIKTYH